MKSVNKIIFDKIQSVRKDFENRGVYHKDRYDIETIVCENVRGIIYRKVGIIIERHIEFKDFEV